MVPKGDGFDELALPIYSIASRSERVVRILVFFLSSPIGLWHILRLVEAAAEIPRSKRDGLQMFYIHLSIRISRTVKTFSRIPDTSSVDRTRRSV